LLRGLGLGFLFLSINLIAFSDLNKRNRAAGIGLFNTGRLLGGLIGVAGLETLIEHNIVGNLTVLGANVTPGVAAVSERLATTATMLTARGMDAFAGRAAISLLDRVVIDQSTVIAFNTAFNAVALLFVFAAPVLVTIKIVLHRYMHAAQHPHIEEPQIAGIANSDDGELDRAIPRHPSETFIATEKYREDAFALADRSRLLDRLDIDRAGAISL
jgi:DHA2 family multidrug resistance protein